MLSNKAVLHYAMQYNTILVAQYHGEEVVLLYDGQHAVSVSRQRGQQVVAVVHRLSRPRDLVTSQNDTLHCHTFKHT